ncbi:helix-turn-helix domain-containing protein [Yeosuana sp. AK3]
MINSDDFAKRIQEVIAFYGESASSFAEKIGVPRSSISHILSGRNKPSLEFVLKILSTYPDIELYWLLNGKGSFPSNKETPSEKEPTFEKHSDATLKNILKESNQNKEIERILIFFKDGTFKNYEN